MTPARRAKFERLVDAMERENYWCGVADEEGNSERLAKHGPLADAARAALTAFVEAEEGEEYEVAPLRHTVNPSKGGTEIEETVTLPFLLLSGAYTPGDKVRVAKVEEGT